MPSKLLGSLRPAVGRNAEEGLLAHGGVGVGLLAVAGRDQHHDEDGYGGGAEDVNPAVHPEAGREAHVHLGGADVVAPVGWAVVPVGAGVRVLPTGAVFGEQADGLGLAVVRPKRDEVQALEGGEGFTDAALPVALGIVEVEQLREYTCPVVISWRLSVPPPASHSRVM